MKNLLLGKVEALLDYVAASDHPVSLKELKAELGFSLTALSRIAADLCEMGLLEKAGYHTFVPGLGICRLHKAAQRNAPLCKAAQRVLNAFASQNDLNVLLTAMEKRQIFPLFSRIFSTDQQNLLWRTGAAVMVLASQDLPAEKARQLFAAENPKAGSTESIIFEQELVSAKRDGMLLRIQQLRQWSLSLPFAFRETPCVLTVFGKVPERFNPSSFEMECRRLVSQVSASAKGLFTDEK